MIIFLCVMLFIVLVGMKTDSISGDACFATIVIGLLFSILKVGGWL